MQSSSGRPPVNPSGQAILRAAVGAYLLYISYHLFFDATDDVSPALRVAAGAFFALAGLGIIAYAYVQYRSSGRKAREEEPGTDAANAETDDDAPAEP